MTKTESSAAAVTAWFGQRLPDEWTAVPPRISVDREEILVLLTVPDPDDLPTPEQGDDAGHAARAEAVAGRVARWRDETRGHRIQIAREAEHRFGRKVAWGVLCAGTEEVFTNLAVPVMTRLRQSERLVLDTLVDAGVARSRAHGLAWCVKLVGENAETWLSDLRDAMAHVEKVRGEGPGAQSDR